jgi:hypothetical protein
VTQPVKNPSSDQLLGFQKPEMVSVDAKKWQAVRRQLVRLVIGWRYAAKESGRILETCRHADGCRAAAGDHTAPCLPACPDREVRLSALVIAHNAELYAMLRETMGLPLRVDGDFHPPSRETWDAVVSELEAVREGKDVLNEIMDAMARGQTIKPSWTEPGTVTAEPAERPMTRLLPAEPEEEPEEEEPGDIDLTDSEPPSDEGADT